MIGVNENTLRIFQDGLENISIHRETLMQSSERHSDYNSVKSKEVPEEKEPRSDSVSKHIGDVSDNTYVVGKIFCQICYGHSLL